MTPPVAHRRVLVVALAALGLACSSRTATPRSAPDRGPDAAVHTTTAREAPPFCTQMQLPVEHRDSRIGPLLPLSASEILVVASFSSILRHDAETWTTEVAGSVVEPINDLAVTGPEQVIAVGQMGLVRRFDGASWTSYTVIREENLFAVAAFEDGTAIAVSSTGRAFRLSGTGYEPMETGTRNTLFDVWGSGPSDVFAVGDRGTILHYDGRSWTPQASGTSADLLAIWGFGPSDLHAVGRDGTLLHYDGASWRPLRTGADRYDLARVWGAGPDDLYVLGQSINPMPGLIDPDAHDVLFRWDGAALRHVGPRLAEAVSHMTGMAPDLLFLSGYEGTLLRCDLRLGPASP